jgi:hypothetical protein
MISAAAVGGFDGPISLGCSASAGLTCVFNPSTITPGSSTAATLTISATSTAPVNGYGFAYIMPGLGFFGIVVATRKRKPLASKGILTVLGLLLFIPLFSLFLAGCGSTKSSSSNTQTPASQVSLTVTGTSGAITQSTPLTVNIN